MNKKHHPARGEKPNGVVFGLWPTKP